jgi:hypothetical protein
MRAIDVGVPLRVRVDTQLLDARVDKVAPEIDAAARMIFVDASLEVMGKDRQYVRSGQVARVFTADAESVPR